jgi:hypothetical protein
MSIRDLCVIVWLVAAECALFAPGLGEIYLGILINIVALPKLEILIFASSQQRKLSRRGENSPGLTGFRVAGWASLACVLAALMIVPGVYGALVSTFNPVRELCLRTFGFRPETYSTKNIAIHWGAETSTYLSISLVLTMTMLVIAGVGAWLGSRRRVTSARADNEP